MQGTLEFLPMFNLAGSNLRPSTALATFLSPFADAFLKMLKEPLISALIVIPSLLLIR